MSLAGAELDAVFVTKLAKLRGEPRPARFLISRMLWHSGLGSLFTIPCGDYRLRFYPTAYSATLWLDPSQRLPDETVLRNLLQPGDVVVDVGANIGAITLAAAAAVGTAGQVYAIEAHPRTYKYLMGNIGLNRARNVTAFNVACGYENGSVSFSDKMSDDQNAIADEGIRVPLRRLDDLLPPKAIKLLKIDVEGYEKFVLEGAAMLLPNVEFIYFESYARHFEAFGYRLRDILIFLRHLDFSVYHLNGERIPDTYDSLVCENLLARRA